MSPSHLAQPHPPTTAGGLRAGSSSVPKPASEAVSSTKKKEEVDVVDGVKIMSKWFDVLNGLLLQVQIDPIHIYAPRKSLAYSSHKVSRHVKDALNQAAIIHIMLPSISLENVAHKPMIQQFTSVMPFVLPDSLWNINRDNLPWTLKLSQFAVEDTTHLNGSKVTLLEPISTNCTLGLNVKSQGFAVCIHADMTPLKASLSDEQLAHVIILLERVLNSMAIMYPEMFADGDGGNQGKDVTAVQAATAAAAAAASETDYAVKMRGLSTTSTISHEQSSHRKQSSTGSASPETEDPLKLGSDAKLEGQLSVWVQWTLPQASLSLLTAAAGGTKQRLQFTVEDYQSSFDWNPVYFQSKLRILTAGIKHHIANKNEEWTEGPNQGVILSFGSDITSDLETVSYY